ncbi:MAG TPA: hypothetical protein VGZ00_06605 [Candidatus Baltobacteraceae bacterium]|jgi:hypothetical protein|nr:hypothetical protein [Candidatus Baltobacteraceae bacterium]
MQNIAYLLDERDEARPDSREESISGIIELPKADSWKSWTRWNESNRLRDDGGPCLLYNRLARICAGNGWKVVEYNCLNKSSGRCERPEYEKPGDDSFSQGQEAFVHDHKHGKIINILPFPRRIADAVAYAQSCGAGPVKVLGPELIQRAIWAEIIKQQFECEQAIVQAIRNDLPRSIDINFGASKTREKIVRELAGFGMQPSYPDNKDDLEDSADRENTVYRSLLQDYIKGKQAHSCDLNLARDIDAIRIRIREEGWYKALKINPTKAGKAKMRKPYMDAQINDGTSPHFGIRSL